MTTRVIPPNTAAIGSAYGRTYNGAAYYDVPDQDAFLLTANGWVGFGCGHHGLAGPTSARPTPPAGSYTDTTLGKVITWVPTMPQSNSLAGFWSDYQGNSV